MGTSKESLIFASASLRHKNLQDIGINFIVVLFVILHKAPLNEADWKFCPQSLKKSDPHEDG